MELPAKCPLESMPNWQSHNEGCPHGSDYVKKCDEFSKWYWFKSSQNEPMNQETVQDIYGKGRYDVMKDFLDYVESQTSDMSTRKFFKQVIDDYLNEKITNKQADKTTA